MAPQYKVTYFPVEAVAEPMRWLLSYGNLDWEDNRINRSDWPKIKPTTPFGQIPLLEFDGKVYWQNAAICRYLARELNLTGKTNKDALQADIIVDTITDFRAPLASFYYDQNQETKEAKLPALLNETVPFFVSRLEKIVKENNGYFVNGQLTWADIYFVAMSDYLQLMANGADFFTGNPNLTALKQKILAFPQIQAWIARRPANIL